MEFSDIKNFAQFTFAIPDILVGASIILMILFKLIFGEKRSHAIFPKLSLILSLFCLIVTLAYSSINESFSNSLFTYNYNLTYFKTILLSCSVITFLTINISKSYKTFNSSLYFLIFGVIGSIIICLSSNNFLSLMLGLELYSFSVCFLLMIKQDSGGIRQNAIRFLLTSSVMTAVLFFGMSLYYAQFGSLSFSKLHLDNSFLSIIGTIFILSGLLFKLGAAPFHSWAIDVYERAPISIVLFFDTIWKFFMVFIFIRFFTIVINCKCNQYTLFLTILSLMSLIIGSIMPIFQKNIKKFIAYASVGHIGFIIAVFATTNKIENTSLVMTYMVSYCLASVLFFIPIITLKKFKKVETFNDICGLIHYSPILGYSIVISMFAMIAMPPFINFIAKLQILKLLIFNKNYILLNASIIHSVLSLFYVAKYAMYVFKDQNQIIDIKIPKNTKALIIGNFALLSISVFGYQIISNWFSEILTRI